MSAAQRAVDLLLDAKPAKGKLGGVGKKRQSAVPPPPAEDEFSPEDMREMVRKTLKYGKYFQLLSIIEGHHDSEVGGYVDRTSSHYVHERSTTFHLSCEAYQWSTKDGEPLDEEASNRIDALANLVEKDISEQIVDINHSIYKSLETEHNYQLYGEGAEESIRANEYKFDAEGKPVEGEGLEFDQLDEYGKRSAKEWWAEANSGDSFWYENTLEDWQDRLLEMGFGYKGAKPEINFSGFSSQGDGASFTCETFDFVTYVNYLATGKAKDMGL